jgi:hypothetical protein
MLELEGLKEVFFFFGMRAVSRVLKNLLNSFIINQKDSHPWALTAVYASPVPTTRELLWNFLTQFDEFYGIPWMLVGDFFHSYDKQGGGALKLYFSLLIASLLLALLLTSNSFIRS